MDGRRWRVLAHDRLSDHACRSAGVRRSDGSVSFRAEGLVARRWNRLGFVPACAPPSGARIGSGLARGSFMSARAMDQKRKAAVNDRKAVAVILVGINTRNCLKISYSTVHN